MKTSLWHSFLHWIYIIKELDFGYGKKLHCDRNFLIKRAKTTNDNLVECHFLTQQFLLIVATVCSTCLNTASAIRYTLHQLFFVCTRVERTSIARILTFHLSFVCWVILNWCSKEREVRHPYQIFLIFSNHFEGKKSNVWQSWHIHVWRLKCYYTCQKWRLDWNSIQTLTLNMM